MNTEESDGSNDIDDMDDVEEDEDVVVSEDGDDVSDLTGEVNVEELVAKLESTPKDDLDRQRQIRRRLDELREERDALKNIDSTYNFNLDEDL